MDQSVQMPILLVGEIGMHRSPELAGFKRIILHEL
jgi:hypothetical protein